MEIEAGRISGLDFLAFGDGVPLVVLPGLTPRNHNPTGLERRQTVAMHRRIATWHRVHIVQRRVGIAVDATMRDLANDYANAIRERFAAPMRVYGISTGGSLALQLALDHPDVVDRVVVGSAACRLGPNGRRVQQALADAIRAGAARVGWRKIGTAVDTRRIPSQLLGAMIWALAPMMATDQPDDVLHTLAAEDAFDVCARLPELEVPMLVVGGACDGFYTPELFRETAERAPHGRLVLREKLGHMAVLMNRDVLREIVLFLGRPRNQLLVS